VPVVSLLNWHEKHRITGFAADMIAVLQRYSLPGNVQELEDMVERATVNLRATGSSGCPKVVRRTLAQTAKALPLAPCAQVLQ